MSQDNTVSGDVRKCDGCLSEANVMRFGLVDMDDSSDRRKDGRSGAIFAMNVGDSSLAAVVMIVVGT